MAKSTSATTARAPMGARYGFAGNPLSEGVGERECHTGDRASDSATDATDLAARLIEGPAIPCPANEPTGEKTDHEAEEGAQEREHRAMSGAANSRLETRPCAHRRRS